MTKGCDQRQAASGTLKQESQPGRLRAWLFTGLLPLEVRSRVL